MLNMHNIHIHIFNDPCLAFLETKLEGCCMNNANTALQISGLLNCTQQLTRCYLRASYSISFNEGEGITASVLITEPCAHLHSTALLLHVQYLSLHTASP